MGNVIGELKSESTFGKRAIESKVTRSGETVTATIGSDQGDVVMVSVSADGAIAVTVSRDGMMVHSWATGQQP
jgi:hypothetical protein